MITVEQYQKAKRRFAEFKSEGLVYILANKQEYDQVCSTISQFSKHVRRLERSIKLYDKWLAKCSWWQPMVFLYWSYVHPRRHAAMIDFYMSGIDFEQAYKMAKSI